MKENGPTTLGHVLYIVQRDKIEVERGNVRFLLNGGETQTRRTEPTLKEKNAFIYVQLGMKIG